MSWDVFVQDLPRQAESIEDIPQDFLPQPILARARIAEVMREVAPFTDFSAPECWRIRCVVFSIEVRIGTEGPSNAFALHIGGRGEAAEFVSEILESLQVRVLDPSYGTGLFDRSPQKDFENGRPTGIKLFIRKTETDHG